MIPRAQIDPYHACDWHDAYDQFTGQQDWNNDRYGEREDAEQQEEVEMELFGTYLGLGAYVYYNAPDFILHVPGEISSGATIRLDRAAVDALLKFAESLPEDV